MNIQIDIIVAMVQGLGLLCILAIAFGTWTRAHLSPNAKSILAGFAFGTAAVLAMLSPAELRPGVIVDLRTVLVAASAVFGGVPGVLISTGMAALFRWFAVGGEGALPGVISIFAAGMIGMLWSQLHPRSRSPKIPDLAIAGALISLSFLVIYMMPLNRANMVMLTVYPYVLVSSILGTMLLGLLSNRERLIIERERDLRMVAQTDPLTGLANRRGFERTIERRQFLASQHEIPAVLVIFDIDHFKLINDRFGHAVGDIALIHVADTLRLGVRPQDVVARLGGEEFGILFENTSRWDAQAIVERLLHKLRTTPFSANGLDVKITSSAGLAEFYGDGDAFEDTLALADEALYRAKNDGRDRLKVAPTYDQPERAAKSG